MKAGRGKFCFSRWAILLCSAAADIDESSVMQLAEMGFPLEACRKAVYFTGNTGAEVAFNWIIVHMEEPGRWQYGSTLGFISPRVIPKEEFSDGEMLQLEQSHHLNLLINSFLEITSSLKVSTFFDQKIIRKMWCLLQV